MSIYEFIKYVKEQLWECTQKFNPKRIDIPAPFPSGFFLEIQYSFTNSNTQNYFNIWLNRKLDGQPEEVVLEYLNVQGPPSAMFDDTLDRIMDELNAYWTEDAIHSAFDLYKSIPIKDGKLTAGFCAFDAGASHEDVCKWFEGFEIVDVNSIRGTMTDRRGYRAKLVLDAETVKKLAPLFHGTPDLTRYGIQPYSTVLKKEVTFDNGVTATYQVTANSVVKPLAAHAQLSRNDDFDWDDSIDLLNTFILHDENGNDYFLDVVAEELPRTMGDAVRSMDNEELAEFLFKINHGKKFLNVGNALAYVCSVAQNGKV